MLQSFIHPKGTSNFIVRVAWSPDNCTMDSCININKLNDLELEAQDRASTYDEQHCVLIPMSGNVLSTQLERLCSCIAEHMHLASQQMYKVNSMVLTFKIDSEDRVWLLWCEQLEVGDDLGNPIRAAVADAHLIIGDGEDEDEKTKPNNQSVKNRDSRIESSTGKKQREAEEEPEFIESDEEIPQRSRSDDVDGSDEEPRHRPTSVDSEEMDPADFVLLPKGEQERNRKKKASTKKSRQIDSDPEEQSGSEPPSPTVDRKRGTKARDKSDKRDLKREKELKMIMAEEKRKREEAEKKALDAEEKLRRAEAKARTAESRLKKVQGSKAELTASDKTQKVTKKGTSLPTIAAPSTRSRPSSNGPKMEALVDIDLEKDLDPQSVADMAKEVVKAADINGDEAEAEQDFSATADIKLPDESVHDLDTWQDDLPSDKPQTTEFDIAAAERGVPDPEDESEQFPGATNAVEGESGAESRESESEEAQGIIESEMDAQLKPPAEDALIEPAVEDDAAMDTEITVEKEIDDGFHAVVDAPSESNTVEENDQEADQVSAPVVHVAPLESDPATSISADAAELTTTIVQGEAEAADPRDDAYDPEEYDDKPIENVQSLEAKAPPAKREESAAEEATAAAAAAVAAATAVEDVSPAAPNAQFSVEVSGSTDSDAKMPQPAKAKAPKDDPDVELKCAKNLVTVELSSAEPISGLVRNSGPESGHLGRNIDGDEVDRDLRMVYHADANQFRSEMRVGTSTSKWQSQGMDTVMDGERVATNVSCFAETGDGFSVSSMFDDDGLQPPHMQALIKGQVSHAEVTDETQRCEDFVEVSKAIPDPIPDFHKPSDDAQQTTDKDGVLLELTLPLKKVKGKPDKQRELRVEVICTPIIKSQDPGKEEDPMTLKMELGLPDILWKHDDSKGVKVIGSSDEIPREESENRFLQFDDRSKGYEQSHIESLSCTELDKQDVGHALEVVKTFGANAKFLLGEDRETSSENILKNSEWAFDEYMRPETHSIAAYSKKLADEEEPCETMEVKFDATFASDSERMLFAKAQRDKLAKMLGIDPGLIEIAGVKPGSPITMIKFNIKKSDSAMIPDSGPGPAGSHDEAAAPLESFDMPALSITMTETGGEDAHRQLGQRLKACGGLAGIPVEDMAVQSTLNKTAPGEVLDSLKAYSRENQPQPRFDSDGRAKGCQDESIPGTRFEDSNQFTVVSGEVDSIVTDAKKDKGEMATLDEDGVDRVYKPGREMMTDDQFSSAKVQRRPPKPATRMQEIPLAHEGEVEEQVKVPFEEVDNCRRLKEREDELNFLPAQRAAMGPRTAIMAKKDEGLEDHRFDRLNEHDSRMEERLKEDASKQPSLKLTKAVEETEYELAQKITGLEDPRTSVPCEPAGLSTGDRKQKKKGKNGEKLHKAAIPEHYMAFGTEGESQRLAPSVVTLEKPGMQMEVDSKKGDVKGDPELLDKNAPDVLTMKFDVSFVDEKSRAQFAEAQRQKLAALLKIPVEALSVRSAVPGSPLTVVTFEIDPNVVARALDDAELMHNSRPFDNPVLDIGVTSAMDESADAIMKRMKVIVGPKVPIARQSIVPGKNGEHLKEKGVKFSTGGQNEPVPAYMRSREELEARAHKSGGALVADKETAELGSGDMNAKAAEAKKAQMAESGMDDKKPVLSYDRRLPKNAKNKQHLLSRIHTIESTLQRLYGKLEADNEYPSVESIEQIMSSTIKQAVFTTDEGSQLDQSAAKSRKEKSHDTPMDDQDLEEEEEHEHGMGDQGSPVDEQTRRANIRAERRRRMEERERTRAERGNLEVKKPSATATATGVRFGEATEEVQPGDINRMKQLQMDEEDLRLQPSNIPAYGDHDDSLAGEKMKGLKNMGRSMGTTQDTFDDEQGQMSPMRSTQRSGGHDGGLTNEELQQMASSDDQNAWKSAFSKVRHGKKNDLVSMLDAGCPVDLKDSQGNTLLNVAAQNGQKSIIKALLRRGAALNTQNQNGQTPLHFCFTYGYEDLGKYLISKGADDTLQNFSGLTCYEGLGE